MSEQIAADATPEATEQVDQTVEPIPGETELGDAGKKALDAMKAERNAAKAEAKANRDALDAIRAEIAAKDKPAEELALEAARREATEAATKAANARILKAELKTAAKGVLADPADALAFIDLTTFEVDDNGDVDSDALNDAIHQLIQKKPHLAAGKQSPFNGGADGGSRAPAKPTATLDEQIAAARVSGNWRAELQLQNSKLPDPIK